MKKQRARRTRRLNFFKLILLLLLLMTLITLGAGGGFLAGIIRNLPSWQPGSVQSALTTFIYDRDQAKITELHGVENRVLVPRSQIPDNLISAVIAIEDNNFNEHFGISPRGILRAAWTNLRSGSIEQGGSTITQQLAKIAYLDNSERTFQRKLQDALLAIQLERVYTKDEIIEFYLNQIYFGHGAYGVQAAARTFFAKDVQELTLGESSLLAGVIRSPGRYSPYLNPEVALGRRSQVLSSMVQVGMISEEQAAQTSKEPLKLAPLNQKTINYPHPWFVEHVIDQAEYLLTGAGFEASLLHTGGLRIYTTLDSGIQTEMERIYTDPKNFPELKTTPPMQSAMVILNPHSGEVLALVGGREHTTQRGFNRATQAKRQPGSAIKPLVVYGPALELGYSPATVLDDAPVTFENIPDPYSPDNYDGRYRGLITMREAVQWSVNIPAVRLLKDIGAAQGLNMGVKLGLPLTQKDRNLSLALGGITEGVTPLQLASAYGAFANQGIWVEQHVITKITDSAGKVLVETRPQQKAIMSEQTAFLMTDMLQTVVQAGTGTRAKMNRPVAGKTGTTQLPNDMVNKKLKGNKDAWFAAYTPELVGVVWMGYDITDKDHYLPQVYGGRYPAQIWKTVMEFALKNIPVKQFNRPEGLIPITVDRKSGMLPGELTPGEHLISELFTQKNVPQKVSEVWVEKEICSVTGELYSPYCPEPPITKVFLQRPPFDPERKPPEDSTLMTPDGLCTLHTYSLINEESRPELLPQPEPEQNDNNKTTSSPTNEQTNSNIFKLQAQLQTNGTQPSVELRWESPYNQPLEYTIQRWSDQQPQAASIAVTLTTTYRDPVPDNSKQLFYRLIVMNRSNQTIEYSDTVSVKLQ